MNILVLVIVGMFGLGLLGGLSLLVYFLARGTRNSRSTHRDRALQAFQQRLPEVRIPLGCGMPQEEIVWLGRQYGYAVTEWPDRYTWYYVLRPAAVGVPHSMNVPPPPPPAPPRGAPASPYDRTAQPAQRFGPAPGHSAAPVPTPEDLQRTRRELAGQRAAAATWPRLCGFVALTLLFGGLAIGRYVAEDDAFVPLTGLTAICLIPTVITLVGLVTSRRRSAQKR